MYSVEVTFGHTRRNGEQLSKNHLVQAEEQILTLFARCFGGGYRYYASGSYQTAGTNLVIEPCTIARAYTPAVHEHVAAIHALARDIAYLLDQACVCVTIAQVDGSLVLIPPE